MVNAKILANGKLLITADNETRAYIKRRKEEYWWNTLWEIFEGYAVNGSYEPFDPNDANPFVGLTSAPCIAEELDVDDEGNKSIVGSFWYFANYMLVDPLEELKNKGRVIFTLAR